MHHLPRLLALSGVLALAACSGSGGGGLGNIFGGGSTSISCDPGAQAQISNPEPGQSGVSTNLGQITIVTSGDNNALSNNPGNWHLFVTDNFGGVFDSNSLILARRNGPAPYGSDFYYSGSIPTLNPGTTYTVRLQQGADGSTCTPFALQSFNT